MTDFTTEPDGSLITRQTFRAQDLEHFTQTDRALLRVASEAFIDAVAGIIARHPISHEGVVEDMSDEEYVGITTELAGIILLECSRIIHETVGAFTSEFESAIPRPGGGEVAFRMTDGGDE